MRILFLNQFFWPDSSATSQLLTDLARGLATRGHDVTVVCADGGYGPANREDKPPVVIERVRALRFARGRVGRLLSYLSFYVFALVKICLLRRVDVVVSLTTPPLICLLGSWIKTLRGSRHIIWEMDVYPDVAVGLRHFRAGGLADRVTGALADYSRKQSDGIIALGECMKDRLASRGIDPSKIFIAENWADGEAIRPNVRPGDPNQLVMLYSGNLGLAHDLDTIIGCIGNLRNDSRFRFLFVGGGGRRNELAEACRSGNFTSVELRPYAPRESLGKSLSLGDIGLVTQNDACCGSVVPSKVYGILAAGRPVLFIGPRDSTPAVIIRTFECGWHVDCGDVDGLTTLLLRLASNRPEVAAAGDRARLALLEHYDLSIGVDRIANILEHLQTSNSAVLNTDLTKTHSSTAQHSSLNRKTVSLTEEEASCSLSQL